MITRVLEGAELWWVVRDFIVDRGAGEGNLSPLSLLFLGVGADEAHYVRVDPVWQELVVVYGVLWAGRCVHLLHGAQDGLAVIVGDSRAAATLPVNHMAEYV